MTPAAKAAATAETARPEEKKDKLSGLTLPDGPKDIVRDLAKYVILIYGDHGLGKSTFCASNPDCIFLATEPGLKGLKVADRSPATWAEFIKYAQLIKEGNHKFKTVVVDTLDGAYALCRNHMLKQLQIDDESDMEWGKGWRACTNEFMRVMQALGQLPYGLWLTAHADDVEMKSRTGKTFTKRMPALPKSPRKAILDFCDFVFYLDVEEEKQKDGSVLLMRHLRSKPTSDYEAKDRLGVFPESLPLLLSAVKESFEAGVKLIDSNPASQALTLNTPASIDGARADNVAAPGVVGKPEAADPLDKESDGKPEDKPTEQAPAAKVVPIDPPAKIASTESGASPAMQEVSDDNYLLAFVEKFLGAEPKKLLASCIKNNQHRNAATFNLIVEHVIDKYKKRDTAQEASMRKLCRVVYHTIDNTDEKQIHELPADQFVEIAHKWLVAIDAKIEEIKTKKKESPA